ncbi:MAG: UPF0149 family protein [Gammaproteobacteria bacterium]|nr:UPF0149 family protein [Gammaproteobacteria bacterium]MCF6231349.1 UPF0149 family protein [Gammaproteobacteria bacterium]
MRNSAPLSASQVRLLSSSLADDKSEQCLSYPALCGFLFAVGCVPETLAESEWLPLVFEVDGQSNRREGPTVELIRQLQASISQQIEEGSVEIPEQCRPVVATMDNLQSGSAFSQWCAGFLGAHDWLDELWLEYTPEAMLDEQSTTVLLLSFFASERLAREYCSDLNDQSYRFEEVAEQVLALHSEALQRYAGLGRAILVALQEIEAQPLQPGEAQQEIGQDEPCPCNSGKQFKQCCGY